MLNEYKGNFVEYLEKVFGGVTTESSTYMFDEPIRRLSIEVSDSNVGIVPSPDNKTYIVVEGSKIGLTVELKNSRLEFLREPIYSSLCSFKSTIFVPKSVKILWVDANTGSCVASNVRYEKAIISASSGSQVGFASKETNIESSSGAQIYCCVLDGGLVATASSDSNIKAKGTFTAIKVTSSSGAKISTKGDCQADYIVKASNSKIIHKGKIQGQLDKSLSAEATFDWIKPENLNDSSTDSSTDYFQEFFVDSLKKPIADREPEFYEEEIRMSIIKIVGALNNKVDIPANKITPCESIISVLLNALLISDFSEEEKSLAFDNIVKIVAKSKHLFDLLNIPFFEGGIQDKLEPFMEELNSLLEQFSDLSSRIAKTLK